MDTIFVCHYFGFELYGFEILFAKLSLAAFLRLIKCLTASTNMLFWSFCLLTFFQCVSGLVISTLCRDFIQDATQPIELRSLECLPEWLE